VLAAEHHAAGPAPPDGDELLPELAELLASAIAADRDRAELRHAAVEQAALGRLAKLVAEGVPDHELFSALAQEISALLEVPAVTVVRYEPDHASETVVASVGTNGFPVGSRWPVVEPHLGAAVLRRRGPARIDDYTELAGAIADGVRRSAVGSTVGVPIFVGRDPWGLLCVGRKDGRLLPADTEERLAKFGELVSIAISDAQARDRLRAMADEQASLHHVADLVAHGAAAQTVFDAICAETGHLIRADAVNLSEFSPDGCLVLAGWSRDESHLVPGQRYRIGHDTVTGLVKATGAPSRIDSYDAATSELAVATRARGVRSAVGVPVIVEGQVWGVLQVGMTSTAPLPAGVEHQLASFTDLAATAISNAAARSALIDSRARIVAAGDEARRRVERNLHDGVQQHLIVLGLDLQALETLVPLEAADAHAQLRRARAVTDSLVEELQQVSRGLHPSALSHGGLPHAVRALARTSPIPVALALDCDERLPESIEICAYYVVSECLTNAAKHAHAQRMAVEVRARAGVLRVLAEDDGCGGADARGGSGLIGLMDRVEALGGQLRLESPPGGGTRIAVEVPIPTDGRPSPESPV
jgi:signal transduction histidine kinase